MAKRSHFLVALLLALHTAGIAQPNKAERASAPDDRLSPESVVQFLNDFELLGDKKDFSLLSDMIHERVFYRLNDGDFLGKAAVKEIVERTWATYRTVQNARFYLSDIRVIHTDQASASATFTYNWEWIKDGRPFRAQGRGTRIMTLEQGRLKVIHMHLSPFPSELLLRATQAPSPAQRQ